MINTARFAMAPLTISITDINDNCPQFEVPSYDAQVSQDDLYVADATGERLIIHAVDEDSQFSGTFLLDQVGTVFEVVESDENPGEVYIKLAEPENLNTDGSPHELMVIYQHLYCRLYPR